MAANLAPVYVNDERVTLQGDPKPVVSKIVEASGKKPDNVHVVRLKNQADTDGKPIALGEFIDRNTTSNAPVYLKCFEGGTESAPASLEEGEKTSTGEPAVEGEAVEGGAEAPMAAESPEETPPAPEEE